MIINSPLAKNAPKTYRYMAQIIRPNPEVSEMHGCLVHDSQTVEIVLANPVELLTVIEMAAILNPGWECYNAWVPVEGIELPSLS